MTIVEELSKKTQDLYQGMFVGVETENLTAPDDKGNVVSVNNSRQNKCKLLLAEIISSQPKAEE